MEGPLVERVLTLAQNSSIMLSAEALYVIVNAFGMAEKDNLYNFLQHYGQEALVPLVKALTEPHRYDKHLLSEIIGGIERVLSIDCDFTGFDQEDTIGFMFDSCDGFGIL